MHVRQLTRPASAAAPLLALGLAIAGCGGSSGPAAAGTSGTLSGVGPIKVLLGADSGHSMTSLIKEWNAAHPDQKVTVVTLPQSADDQRQLMIQDFQTKAGTYAVMEIDAVWNAEFASHGWLTALPKKQVQASGYIPATLRTGDYFGKLYSVPFDSGAGLFFGRTDLLTKAGIKALPTTWAQMKSDCAAVRKLPGDAKMDCYAGQFDKYEGLTVNFAEAVDSAGGQIVNDKLQPTLNTTAAKTGLQFLVDGFTNGMFPKASITWQEDDARNDFQNGNLIFMRNWAYVWDLMNATDGSSKVAGKFAVGQIPGLSGPGKPTLGQNNLAVSAYAKHQKTALSFLSWFNDKAHSATLMKSGYIDASGYTANWQDPALLQAIPYAKAQATAMANSQARPAFVQYGDATAAIQDDVYAAITGRMSVGAALSDLQKKLTTIVNQTR
jgi:multiple sugar transport system substrate-binding protein